MEKKFQDMFVGVSMSFHKMQEFAVWLGGGGGGGLNAIFVTYVHQTTILRGLLSFGFIFPI
jgi:hypothetical protein